MLTVEVKVNGNLIGFIVAVNSGTTNKYGKMLYNCKYSDAGVESKSDHFSVWHLPEEGANVLVGKIFEILNKD